MTDAQAPRVGRESETLRNIYQRRVGARQQVYATNFKKRSGEGLKYRYLSVDDIKPVVERALIDNGIVLDIVGADVEEVTPKYQYDTGRGSKAWWVHMRMTLTIELVNADEPADRVRIEVMGEARDNSDKAYNKLYTAALKNFYKIEYNAVEGEKEGTDDTDALQDDDAIIRANARPQRQAPLPEPEPEPVDLSQEIPESGRSMEDTIALVRKWAMSSFKAGDIYAKFYNEYGKDLTRWGAEPLGQCYVELKTFLESKGGAQ